MPDEMEIEQIIRKKFLEDDPLALELVYEHFGKRLYGYLVSIVKSPSDAEEILNELFMTIVRKREQLGRALNMRTYLFAIARNLPRYGISNEGAVKLITSLAPEKTEYTQSLKKAVDGERITCGGWVFELVLSGRLRSEDLAGLIVDMNWFSKHPKLGSLVISLYKPFAKRDYLEYLKRAERGKSEYDQKYYKLNYGDASVNLILANAQKMRDSIPKYCLLTRELIPSFWVTRLKTAKIETQAQEVRIRLALEEYKNLKGAYPDNLEPIVPQFLKEMPVSEMTGRTFEYSKENEGYKISGGIVEKK